PSLHSSPRTCRRPSLRCCPAREPSLLAKNFGVSLAQERPRRLVIGHVLLHGHARNGAADHVESQVLQRFEPDATFTHVELLAALLVFAGEPTLKAFASKQL